MTVISRLYMTTHRVRKAVSAGLSQRAAWSVRRTSHAIIWARPRLWRIHSISPDRSPPPQIHSLSSLTQLTALRTSTRLVPDPPPHYLIGLNPKHQSTTTMRGTNSICLTSTPEALLGVYRTLLQAFTHETGPSERPGVDQLGVMRC